MRQVIIATLRPFRMKLSLCYWNQTRKLRSDGALCRNHDDDGDENGPVEGENIATKMYIGRKKYNMEQRKETKIQCGEKSHETL